MIEVRQALESDWAEIWPILHDIFLAGETYPHAPQTDEKTAHAYWLASPTATYVAVVKGKIAGSFYIRPNQPALGAHVCNAGFIVGSDFRGKGIGAAMGAHSLLAAKKHGFSAMQFNLVVCTNAPSLRLWQKLGFKIIGTLPRAFNHRQLGLVDAHVMYRLLDDIEVAGNGE